MSGPPPRAATCHPERKHTALGLCRDCWELDRRTTATTERGRRRRAAQLKFKFGLSIEQYEAMLDRQGGLCAICLKPPKFRRLGVDHDHETERVRGLLCWWCNNRMAVSKNTPDVLRRALAYLESDFDGRKL
jgi:Recombination endonuclease VII